MFDYRKSIIFEHPIEKSINEIKLNVQIKKSENLHYSNNMYKYICTCMLRILNKLLRTE